MPSSTHLLRRVGRRTDLGIELGVGPAAAWGRPSGSFRNTVVMLNPQSASPTTFRRRAVGQRRTAVRSSLTCRNVCLTCVFWNGILLQPTPNPEREGASSASHSVPSLALRLVVVRVAGNERR